MAESQPQAEPQKLSQEEYDQLRGKLEDKYDYDNMSDEEKARFNDTMDKVAVVDDKKDTTDKPEDDDDNEPNDAKDGPERGDNHHSRTQDDDEYIR